MKKTLYVGNLPYSVTEQSLAAHFTKYGSQNARIIEGRGFGFVDVDAEQLQEAIKDANNTDMGGRTITVNEARPKEDRPSGDRNYNSGRSRY